MQNLSVTIIFHFCWFQNFKYHTSYKLITAHHYLVLHLFLGFLALIISCIVFALAFHQDCVKMDYIYKHWLQFVTASIVYSLLLSVYLYVRSLFRPQSELAPEVTGEVVLRLFSLGVNFASFGWDFAFVDINCCLVYNTFANWYGKKLNYHFKNEVKLGNLKINSLQKWMMMNTWCV